MYMMRTGFMMKQRKKEMKEHDFLSRLGNSDGDGDLDCSLKLGLPDDNRSAHPSTIFYGDSCIYPQVGNNIGLVSGPSAFRPWKISSSDHVACNNNNNLNTGFINDFLGSPPVRPSRRPPPLPTISIQSATSIEHTLSLAPATEVADPDLDGSENGKGCAICRRDNTPLWRNGPHGPKTLCNACGIRFKKWEKKALGITDAIQSRSRNSFKKPKF
ncbi:hypothetical protein NE237_010318 [Protea cynaroides]|uniref:GATA-type domain-containing protein n=1 Tax=Protea cynaroides TaxID=273540 RepID=A0A9Q0KZ31_9MAGN|nr:hypothetical protein NE237_010318 [Protea cynaroides]